MQGKKVHDYLTAFPVVEGPVRFPDLAVPVPPEYNTFDGLETVQQCKDVLKSLGLRRYILVVDGKL